LRRRRRGVRRYLGLKAQQIVTDLYAVTFGHGDPTVDLGAVDLNAVVTFEILDEYRAIIPKELGVSARYVALRKADGIPLLTADRNLVSDERNDGLFSFVVLDDQLVHEWPVLAR
jgi:hypothetical protein